MKHGSLFSGIGGFDLAAEWMGWENIFHCEWNEFGQKVLKYYWPKAISYGDITKTDFSIHRGAIDILTGGFPCQPYSQAGKRLGKEDDRHLWPEMLRAIGEIQPRWVVGENVRGLTNWNGGMVFDEVQADLEAKGYEVLPFLLPACAVNAPHRRDRIWFIALNSKCESSGRQNAGEISGTRVDLEGNILVQKGRHESEYKFNSSGNNGDAANTSIIGRNNGCDNRQERHLSSDEWFATEDKSERNRWKPGIGQTGSIPSNTNCNKRCERRLYAPGSGQTERYIGSRNARSHERGTWHDFPTQSPVCNGDDGISSELDGITFSKWRNESIKGGGNAVVPQVVYQIFKAIEAYERL